MSSHDLIEDVFQVMQMLTSLVMLPSQLNVSASNCADEISGAIATLREKVPMTVPSLAATE